MKSIPINVSANAPCTVSPPQGVIQELYGILLAYYAVRVLMLEAAKPAKLDSDRLSFTHAISLVTSAIPEFQMVVLEQQAHLHQRLAHDLCTSLLLAGQLEEPLAIPSKVAS